MCLIFIVLQRCYTSCLFWLGISFRFGFVASFSLSNWMCMNLITSVYWLCRNYFAVIGSQVRFPFSTGRNTLAHPPPPNPCVHGFISWKQFLPEMVYDEYTIPCHLGKSELYVISDLFKMSTKSNCHISFPVDNECLSVSLIKLAVMLGVCFYKGVGHIYCQRWHWLSYIQDQIHHTSIVLSFVRIRCWRNGMMYLRSRFSALTRDGMRQYDVYL